MEIPKQIFSVIFEEIINHNGYGHESRETAACIEVNVSEMKKAVFIFRHINTERDIIAKEEILKKKLKSSNYDSSDKCEVVAGPSTLLKFNHSQNTEVLSVQFFYGYWNAYGVPQH